MYLSPARLRAIVLPALLVVGLFSASGVSAAEDPTGAAPAATVAGTGVLTASGDGHVRLAGSYLLTGSLDGGSLSIRGVDRWSIVRVTGWVSKTRLADGTVVYRFGERTGQYRIAGRTLATTIESESIRFTAAGHGRATLVGSGSYWVNGRGPLPWSDPGEETAF
jgi:hypothetical protein